MILNDEHWVLTIFHSSYDPSFSQSLFKYKRNDFLLSIHSIHLVALMVICKLRCSSLSGWMKTFEWLFVSNLFSIYLLLNCGLHIILFICFGCENKFSVKFCRYFYCSIQNERSNFKIYITYTFSIFGWINSSFVFGHTIIRPFSFDNWDNAYEITERKPFLIKIMRFLNVHLSLWFELKPLKNMLHFHLVQTFCPNICPFGSIIGILCSFNGEPVTL